jgi:hypothetical protein
MTTYCLPVPFRGLFKALAVPNGTQADGPRMGSFSLGKTLAGTKAPEESLKAGGRHELYGRSVTLPTGGGAIS